MIKVNIASIGTVKDMYFNMSVQEFVDEIQRDSHDQLYVWHDENNFAKIIISFTNGYNLTMNIEKIIFDDVDDLDDIIFDARIRTWRKTQEEK